jgi:hypothetical protein
MFDNQNPFSGLAFISDCKSEKLVRYALLMVEKYSSGRRFFVFEKSDRGGVLSPKKSRCEKK